MQQKVQGCRLATSFNKSLVPPNPILQFQDGHVRSKSHLAHAVRVEVELVFHKVAEVLFYGQEQLEGWAS